jgi:PIN domain nuclease of toxin-antitoxin system
MMRLLLDSHTLIWSQDDTNQLPAAVVAGWSGIESAAWHVKRPVQKNLFDE